MIEYLDICRVHLRSLSLVRMQLNKLSLARLATFVDKSEYLEDLDISWNDLIPLDFVPLLQTISTNKTLVSLNLSCNSLIEKQDQNQSYDLKNISAMDQYVELRKQAI